MFRRNALDIVSFHAPEGKPREQQQAEAAPAHEEEGKPPRRIPICAKPDREADSQQEARKAKPNHRVHSNSNAAMRPPGASCAEKLSFDPKAIVPRQWLSASGTPPSTISFTRSVAQIERSRTGQ